MVFTWLILLIFLACWWRERAANSDMKKHISICLYRSLFCLNFPIPLPIPLSLHPSLIAFLSSPPSPLLLPLLTLSSMFFLTGSLPPSSLPLSLKASGFSSWCILPPGVSLVHRLNWLTVCLFLPPSSPTTHTHTHKYTQSHTHLPHPTNPPCFQLGPTYASPHFKGETSCNYLPKYLVSSRLRAWLSGIPSVCVCVCVCVCDSTDSVGVYECCVPVLLLSWGPPDLARTECWREILQVKDISAAELKLFTFHAVFCSPLVRAYWR